MYLGVGFVFTSLCKNKHILNKTHDDIDDDEHLKQQANTLNWLEEV